MSLKLRYLLGRFPLQRSMCSACEDPNIKKGVILGAYEGCSIGEYTFTPAAAKFDQETGGRLMEIIKGSDLPNGKAKVIHNLGSEFYAVAVAGLGPDSLGYNEMEVLNECKENIRNAVGAGVRGLEKSAVGKILVEGFSCTQAAAEAAALAVWRYQDLKNRDTKVLQSKVDLYEDPDMDGWIKGIHRGEGQNVARKLEEAPANVMTPMGVAQAALEILCPCGIHVDIRDRDWLDEKKFLAFLTMAKGSCEPPLLLEMNYCGGSEGDKPVVLTGKGVTFDSGGICLKKCRGLKEHRADMAGAAVIIGAMKTLASLGTPINVNAIIPLMENMPGGAAIKPGDVLVGMNNKTIRVDDTDHEGRVILADALAFSKNLNPCLCINIATLTLGIRTALGSGATGSFTTSDTVWTELAKAGAETGDRVWRMPLWRFYSQKIKGHTNVDVHNVGEERGATPCQGAAFLLEFAPPVDFLHLDITGTGMECHNDPVYLRKGHMTGRPTRTLFQFLCQMACPMDKAAEC